MATQHPEYQCRECDEQFPDYEAYPHEVTEHVMNYNGQACGGVADYVGSWLSVAPVDPPIPG